MNSRRTLNRLAYRRRALAAARRAVIQRVLVYVAISAASGALWAGLAAWVLHLRGFGVVAFGVSLALATLFAVAVVCSGNHDEEVF
ncbi:MAG: hypothetical protein BWY63_00450 [Chloroflexi bacterium ADurb.Bin360]|nr:MAG: hypothetical protein BWY63_00450 [Chloroflexi bacterium ADurb.Bin360]